MKHNDRILVVGAGFSGATIARYMAEAGYRVDVIDRRDHIGGNAYDYTNEHGIRIHKYGPHIFHTSNVKVVEWLSKYTEWLPYKHRVKALLDDGRFATLPVNKQTRAMVGEERVVDVFYRPYTKKMWGKEIEQIDPDILARVKIRDDENEFYFPDDTFQFMPKNGYTEVFAAILDHYAITVSLETSFEKRLSENYLHTFNSMPIDEYFAYDQGDLPYRSIKFHTYTIPAPILLPTATVNFTHDEPYTRVTEWKHFPNHGKNPAYTTLTVEQPCDYKENEEERYYPVKDIAGTNRMLYQNYLKRAPKNTTFIGRCGLYAYLDMHQAISSAQETARQFLIKQGQVAP